MGHDMELVTEKIRDYASFPKTLGIPSITSVFEEVARSNPDAVALSLGTETMTYDDLNRRANALAHRLQKQGVAKGSIVAIAMERSLELYVSLLAILKAGAAYLPLDVESPARRLSLMLDDAKPSAILIHSPTQERIAALGKTMPVIGVDNQGENDGTDPSVEANHTVEVNGDDLAYVMYTSGSSGTPKGVMIPHRGVVRLVKETNYCEFAPPETFLQLAPISFDASTFEIWGPLLNGAKMAIMPPGLPSLESIGSAIRREGVTTLWLTSALFQLMVDQRPEDLKNLRQLLAGGDVLSPRHVEKALAILDRGVVINGYGPTETTTFACCHRISSTKHIHDRVPIGLPICKTTLHILDENFAQVHAGDVGELWIGGQGLALGYLNDSELTRQKFIADPFSKHPNARLYRTGDLARRRSDGLYDFLGRVDDQVKILGHRVEPAEIERILLDHAQVRAAAVIPFEDARGEKRLAAYVVSQHPIQELKAYLSANLPTAWVPSSLIPVDAIPLNLNGKLDRAALPSPVQDAKEATRQRPVSNAIDPRIVAIWEEALGVNVGPDDNFFDLGGDSLLLIRVHSDIQNVLGTDIALMEMFDFPTIRALDERLSRGTSVAAEFNEVVHRAAQQREALARNKVLRTL